MGASSRAIRAMFAEQAYEDEKAEMRGLAPGEEEPRRGDKRIIPGKRLAEPDDPFAGLQPIEDPFKKYASRYPTDPTLTPAFMARLAQEGELRGTRVEPESGQWPEHPMDYPPPREGFIESAQGLFDPETSALVTGEGEEELPLMGLDRAGTPLAAEWWKGLGMTALSMTTPDSMEIADMLADQYPEHVDVRLSPEGVPVVRNKKTGFQTVINEPGMSGMDVLQGIGLMGAYTPSGRYAMGPREAMKKSLLTGTALAEGRKRATRSAARRAAVTSGITETALQAAQASYGGDFTTEDILLSIATGVAPEYVADPLINLAIKSKELIGQGGRLLPLSISRAIDFAERNGLRITTSDALKETLTPARRIFLKAAERIPFLGTGKARVRQKAQRADVLEKIATEYGLDPLTDYGQQVVNSFARMKTRIIGEPSRNLLGEVGKIRQRVVGVLNEKGAVPLSNLQQMLQQQRKIAAGMEPDVGIQLNSYLDKVEAQLQVMNPGYGKGGADLPPGLGMSFEDVVDYRSSLFKDAGLGLHYTGPKGDLQAQLAMAMRRDMDEFAKKFDQFGAWDKSNFMWREGLDKVRNDTLKQAIKAGRIDTGLVDEVFAHGGRNDMRALYSRLDAPGKVAARRRLMANILHRAGATVDDWSAAKPGRFVQAMDSDPQLIRAMKAFFPKDKYDELMGAKEFLKITADADNIGQGVGMTAAMAGGALITGLLDALVGAAAVTGTLGRIHESAGVRNLLLALNHAKGNPDLTTTIMSELRPLVMQGARLWLDDGRDPFAPQEEPDMVEQFARWGGKTATDIGTAITGFRVPGMGSYSPQSQFDFATGTAGANPADRLRQMSRSMAAPPEETP